MLDFTKTGTYQDSSGYSWMFYGDNSDANLFYVVPRPQPLVDQNGLPALKVVTYQTDGGSNGSGYCQLTTELAVPRDILAEIEQRVPQHFPGANRPVYQVMNVNPDVKAVLSFIDGGSTTEYIAQASSFGGNTATFVLHLTAPQLATLKATLGGAGGSYLVTYYLSVPASLQAVTATLSFDSSIAYQYQVTQARYNSWGDQVSPRTVSQMLQQSGASKVNLVWGTSNPSAELRQSVADWANTTLANLVTAAVNQAIAVQNIQSRDSFTLNQVSSFTAVYSENQVVAWHIQPSATLPSPGIQTLEALSATVDVRQQVMTVAAQLPFSSNGVQPNVPKLDGVTPALIDTVDVTVTYPGLSQSAGSFTFDAQGSHTFTAPYDSAHGPLWSLEYRVNFKGGVSQSFSTTVKDINQGTYALQAPQAGILCVTFDATSVYAARSALIPKKVRVDLMYASAGPSGQPLNQSVMLTADKPTGTITSALTLPINDPYQYNLTYTYADQVFTAPVVRNRTGFYQQVNPALTDQKTQVILAYQPGLMSAPVLGATAKVWYEASPAIPGMGGVPTEDNPTIYSLPVDQTSKDWVFASETFESLVMSRTPLVYSSSINALNGQINVTGQLIENDTSSIMITPTQRYITVTISPAAIDWESGDFDQIQLEITAKTLSDANGGVSKATSPNLNVKRSVSWFKNDSQPFYITYTINLAAAGDAAPSLNYEWFATYLKAGSSPKSTQVQSASSVLLDIPARPV